MIFVVIACQSAIRTRHPNKINAIPSLTEPLCCERACISSDSLRYLEQHVVRQGYGYTNFAAGGSPTLAWSTMVGISVACYRTEKARIPKSAVESAGKSARKKGTAGSSAVSLLFQRKRPPSTAPSNALLTGTLPTTLPGAFQDLGFLRLRSPKAGHNKAGRWDVRNQRFKPDTEKMRKMRKDPLTPEKHGSEEIPPSKLAENAENADTKTRKILKMRLTGFNVTGLRRPP